MPKILHKLKNALRPKSADLVEGKSKAHTDLRGSTLQEQQALLAPGGGLEQSNTPSAQPAPEWVKGSKDTHAYTQIPKNPFLHYDRPGLMGTNDPKSRADVDPSKWKEQNPSAPSGDTTRIRTAQSTIGIGGTRHLEAVLARMTEVQRARAESELDAMPEMFKKFIGEDPGKLLGYLRNKVPNFDELTAEPAEKPEGGLKGLMPRR